MLFGSYAKGTATIDSDIDMAVISPDFGRAPLFEKMDLYEWKYDANLNDELQPFPFSPEQFESDDFFPHSIIH